ncbi:Fatty acid hydroxylase [uncultured virus]|nr:Fatty acid hydroxylase [uncultured virus]
MNIPYFVIHTLFILLLLNIFGIIYSCLILFGNIYDKLRLQTKPNILIYKERFQVIFFNAFILEPMFGLIGLCLFKNYFVDKFHIILTPIQSIIILFIDDLWLYICHRIFHFNKFLFKKIHYFHHKALTPFPMDMHYIHPMEIFIIPLGTFLAFLLIQQVHIFALWIYVIVKTIHEQNVHSGLKSTIRIRIPLINKFLGTTEQHDLHHLKFKGNYSSMFKLFDLVFGTKI